MTVEILVIQTAFVGDLLLSIPLLKNLRKQDPTCKITVLCRQGLGALIESTKLVDQVVEADKSSRQSWKSVTQVLRAKNWDFVFSPHQSVRTLLLVRSLRAAKKIGYRSLGAFFVFDRRVERLAHLPEALRQLLLLENPSLAQVISNYESEQAQLQQKKFLGAAATLLKEPLAQVPKEASMSLEFLTTLKELWQTKRQVPAELSPAVGQWLQKQSNAYRPLVLIAPGSVWATKMWLTERYAEVARELLSRGLRVAIVGAPNETNLGKEIAEKAPGAEMATGLFSLPESCELMALADLLLSNDSGAMHMAALSNTPSLSLFGPTVLKQGYRPWQNQAQVLQADLQCRPCGRHGASKCPLGTHDCMKSITALDVMSEIENWFNPLSNLSH